MESTAFNHERCGANLIDSRDMEFTTFTHERWSPQHILMRDVLTCNCNGFFGTQKKGGGPDRVV